MAVKLPELLCPAGNLEILKTAINAGADAVYFGGKAFNARAGAGNLDLDEIREAVVYADRRNARTYLTLNTLIKESEWEEFTRFARDVIGCGISALIITDLGAARYIRTHYPDFPLHASTQMGIHDLNGAKYLGELGYQRVVLARELPLAEIQAISEGAGIETEVFAHGALCYSYSGRCLMSSYIGGRSGNRGRCAQSCRLAYGCASFSESSGENTGAGAREQHLLNLKDLCSYDVLENLIRTGTSSLKIEGRLKAAPYVAGVCQIYRRALDEYACTGSIHPMTEEEKKRLLLLFNRGGFTKGYLIGDKEQMIFGGSPKHSGIPAGKVVSSSGGKVKLSLHVPVENGDTLEIVTHQAPYPSLIYQEGTWQKLGENASSAFKNIKKDQQVHWLVSRAMNEAILQACPEKKTPVALQAVFHRNALPFARLTVQKEGNPLEIFVRGEEIPQEALLQPMTQESLIKQLSRTGGTAYEFVNPVIEVEDGLFLTNAAQNAFKRRMIAALDEKMQGPVHSFVEKGMPENNKANAGEELVAMVTTHEQLEGLEGMSRVYLRSEYFTPKEVPSLLEKLQEKNPEVCLGVALPYITRMKAAQKAEEELKAWKAQGVTCVLATHYGEIAMARRLGLQVLRDASLPVMNHHSNLWDASEQDEYILSTELSIRELTAEKEEDSNTDRSDNHRFYNFGICLYGRMPAMQSEQCPLRETGHCGEKGNFVLLDRKGESWPIERHCRDCYTVFYTPKPILAYTNPQLLKKMKAKLYMLRFTGEDRETTRSVCLEVRRAFQGKKTEGEWIHWLREGVE